MHETKFAEQIIFVLKNKLEPAMLSKTITVNVKLSPLSHVTAEGLRETFKQLVQNEPFAKNTRLNIQALDFDVYCRKCKKISKQAKPIFKCPVCGCADLDIQKEREFIIDSVEIGSLK